jgi:hypothetical protein
MIKVVDAALAKILVVGARSFGWRFLPAKATKVYGENVWLPEERFRARIVVSIKGP